MLILHDLVEIDAGDAPIHGSHDPAAQEAAERRAADRLYGLLPPTQGPALRRLWEEFEAAGSADAIYAKSIDRVQPVLANLATGGGTWIDYAVTRAQLETRVGEKVRRGAPPLWDALVPRLDAWFGPA
jgi:putative hydrolase of HD superfamily